MEELKFAAVIIVTITVIVLSIAGVFMLVNATENITVIRNCQEQGWHNFGQTRIVCMVEPKKEVK